VAKKVRTPAPPKRPIQAPQKRGTKRPRAGVAPATDRRNLLPIVAVLVVIAVAAIAAALYFGLRNSGHSSGSGSAVVMRVDPAHDAALNSLPGVRKIKSPWPPDYTHLDNRLGPLGLAALSQEQLVYHIHQHLDIYLNGKHLTVPRYIGICCGTQFLYLAQLHSHATDGVIHVESATKHDYTLGDFFADWGVLLNRRCVGGYCHGYKWYVNGKLQHGNPQDLVLKAHLEIVIAIGKPPSTIPSTYAWNGL
jgi:hypothetical protein